MLKVNLNTIFERTLSLSEYLDKMAEPFKEKFLGKKQEYQLNEKITKQLKNYVKDIVIVIFSAEWCKYCPSYVSVLALLTEKTGIKVRVFGGLKTNPLKPKETWRIPPSPPEVKTFDVQETPHIIIFNKSGNQLGIINESTKTKNVLEEEIFHIIMQGT